MPCPPRALSVIGTDGKPRAVLVQGSPSSVSLIVFLIALLLFLSGVWETVRLGLFLWDRVQDREVCRRLVGILAGVTALQTVGFVVYFLQYQKCRPVLGFSLFVVTSIAALSLGWWLMYYAVKDLWNGLPDPFVEFAKREQTML